MGHSAKSLIYISFLSVPFSIDLLFNRVTETKFAFINKSHTVKMLNKIANAFASFYNDNDKLD